MGGWLDNERIYQGLHRLSMVWAVIVRVDLWTLFISRIKEDIMTKMWFSGLIEECDCINKVTENLIINLGLDINVEECSICEKTMLEERIEYMNHSAICDKCSVVTIPCCSCLNLIHTLEDDVNYHDGKSYCEDCFSDLVFCECCNEIVENPHEIKVEDEYVTLCSRCKRDEYFQCNHCSKWFSQDDNNHYSDDNGNWICENCYSDNYQNCSSCGALIDTDSSYYDEHSDQSYCSSCYRDLENSLMDDEPNFRLMRIDNEDEPFAVGMELEFECDGNRKDIAHYVKDELYPLFWCKSDASLSDRNGLEIPCQPMSWEFFLDRGKDKLEDLLEFLQKEGCTAWGTNAGIHISLSKRGFNTSHTYKFLKFFYENPEYIFKISRRKKWNFEKYCDCISLDRKGLAKKFKEDNNGYGCKYEAVNMCHSSHYEIRIFAGTLKTSSVLANIEFCRGVYMYTKQEKAKDISVKRFEQYILGFDPSSYQNFIKLFKIGG